MINFMRNKIVGVEQKDKETLIARGTLVDDIYGMRLKVTVRLSDLAITEISGNLDRVTTPECKEADAFLGEAVGLRVDSPEFSRQVHRSIWRHSCQHYASLLVDCGESLRQAALVLGRGDGRDDQPQESPEKPAAAAPEAAPKSPDRNRSDQPRTWRNKDNKFLIDLHVHTSQASPCSSAPLEELIQEAKRIGLDGICLTDHNHVWDPEKVAEMRRGHDLLILRGNEVTTDQGDMLVFGLDWDIQGITPLAELRRLVLEASGLMIAAHPFRGFLTFGVGKLGLSVDQAKERELFTQVDGLEIRNGKVTAEENGFAEQVAKALDLPAVGGSDAHQVSEVGRHVTAFEEPIDNEQELISALKAGRFQVLSLDTDED